MRKDYSEKEIQGRVGDVVTAWGHHRLMMFVSDVLCNHYFKHATEDQIDTLMEDADRYDEVHMQLLKHFSNNGYYIYGLNGNDYRGVENHD